MENIIGINESYSTKKIALAISGGGYRATLYALGALWRLNELGVLPKLKTITSVSGGSIVSAWLAHNWTKLAFDNTGVASNFTEVIASPIEIFCSQGIDIKAGITGLFSFKDSIGDKIANAYNEHLFKDAKISSLPDTGPEFVFYGTNLQTGSGFQISKAKLHDYQIGDYANPDILLAKVVAISSAFPPILSPVHLDTDPEKWVKGKYSTHFENRELKKRLVLTDGGLYDNLGVERVWKNEGEYSHLLVCDAGAPLTVTDNVNTNWAGQLLRMTDIMTNQQRALRKRQIINSFQDVDENGAQNSYGGTYFGITTKINEYKILDAMTTDNKENGNLKNIRTRLNSFSEKEQGQLINWGYALADAAMRRDVTVAISQPLLKKGSWPKPKYFI
ncbi:MAG: patatin-like phospholipase family protein [Candidatus Saccharibacteria bacterium]|nr:patatin-like phospholipase family protein [Candidatus Saccharibacteria bacterium]